MIMMMPAVQCNDDEADDEDHCTAVAHTKGEKNRFSHGASFKCHNFIA